MAYKVTLLPTVYRWRFASCGSLFSGKRVRAQTILVFGGAEQRGLSLSMLAGAASVGVVLSQHSSSGKRIELGGTDFYW